MHPHGRQPSAHVCLHAHARARTPRHTCVQASFNPLRALPAELGRLPNLEMIRVASCNIAEVPAALRDAPKLAWMR